MSAPQANSDESVNEASADLSDELEQAFSGGVAEQDESSLRLVVLRDVAIVSGLLSLFAGAEAWAALSGASLASLVSVVDGFLVGAATCALAHEWGHFAGARLGGGHAPLKPISGFLPLFDFDYAHNGKRAYEWMGIGGNLGHLAIPVLYFLALPMQGPGQAALVAGAAGFAVFSSIIEWPVIQKSRAGMGALESLGTIPRNFVQRTTPWAVGSALLLFFLVL